MSNEFKIQGKATAITNSQDRLINRLHRSLGPLAGGMILDAADLITIGPIGVFAGMIVGSAVGWWISSIYQYSRHARILWAVVAGLYCTIPFTAVIPLATLVSAVGRLRKRGAEAKGKESLI